jgi:hypothetical protein
MGRAFLSKHIQGSIGQYFREENPSAEMKKAPNGAFD